MVVGGYADEANDYLDHLTIQQYTKSNVTSDHNSNWIT